MPLAVGARLGPYEVVSALGAGGMGEVYRATDTSLKRQVAVKVLPEMVAGDADRLARFQREAEVLASLNHPNIAAVYGLEREGPVRALVMELVEGPTLADLIAGAALNGHGLPVTDVLPIAKQIAEALEAAHEQGIVHRDLKPANIKVRADGAVKVLDFGLAKLTDSTDVVQSPGSAGFSRSPTITTPAMTGVGLILGTAAYMSPEQARGKVVDRRADIWAFGAVLYEMLTARRAFDGETVSDVLARVIEREPDWSALPASLPAGLTRLLHRCLIKDPRARLQAIGEARIHVETLIAGSVEESAQTRTTPASSARRVWMLTSAIGAAAVVAGFAVRGLLTSSPAREPQYLSLSAPSGTDFSAAADSADLSPDGRLVAFIGRTANREERGQLWIRALGSPDARLIENTEGATAPFWSPDSQWVAYFAYRGARWDLMKVAANGGRPERIADATGAGGGRNSGTWGANNLILVGLDQGKPIFAVNANGGALRPQTTLTTVTGPRGGSTTASHFRPTFLPDGKHFLFTVFPAGANAAARGLEVPNAGIFAGSVDSPDVKPIVTGFPATPRFDPYTGRLLYVKPDGSLWAQPFDPTALLIKGEPIKILDGVQYNVSNAASSGFSVGASGTLLYRPQAESPTVTQLAWFDRSGRRITKLGEPGDNRNPALSPDGTRVAVVLFQPAQPNIWIVDASTGRSEQATFKGGQAPLWSADSQSILWHGGVLSVQRAGGGSEATIAGTVVPPIGGGTLEDWSGDGKYVVISTNNVSTNRDVLYGRLERETRLQPFDATIANEIQGQISPDGRWMAYVSNEQGDSDIYVQRFPETGSKQRVSTAGGVQPRWQRDGKALWFVARDGTLTFRPIITMIPSPTFGAPVSLFKTPAANALQAAIGTRAQYDITSDGSRILINEALSEPVSPPVSILLNWDALLRR